MKKSDGTLTPKDLNKKIKGGDLNGVFLFYGEEQFRLNGAVEVIAKKLIPKGTESFNYFKFTGKDTSAAEILAAAEQYPQMSDMKLIVVSDSGLLNNATLTDFKLLIGSVRRIGDNTVYHVIHAVFHRLFNNGVNIITAYFIAVTAVIDKLFAGVIHCGKGSAAVA